MSADFIRKGLPGPPYKIVGYVRREDVNHGVRTPGGKCAKCGASLEHCFYVRGATGEPFVIGVHCISTAGDRGLIEALDIKLEQLAEGERLLTYRRQDSKGATADIQRRELKGLLWRTEVRCAFAEQPHPVACEARKGRTLLEYANACSSSGSIAAVRQLLRKAKKVIV